MASYVYLLAHRTEPRFKIGKAININTRLQQLGRTQFDLSKSQALAVATETDSDNLERLLHRAFAQWRLDSDQVQVSEGTRLAGHSEWFHSECRERLQAFISANIDLLQCTMIESDALQVLVAESMKQSRASVVKTPEQLEYERQREEKRKKQLDAKQNRIARARDEFTRIINELPDVLNVLNELSLDLELVDSEYRDTKYLAGCCAKSDWTDVEAVLKTLFDTPLRYDMGGANIFPCIEKVELDTTVRYKLSVMWPAYSVASDILDEAILRLQTLPTSIRGWPAKSNVVLLNDTFSTTDAAAF